MIYSLLLRSLWLAAYSILGCGLLSGCCLCIWLGWQIWRKGSEPLSSGDDELPAMVMPQRKLTASQVGRMMLLAITLALVSGYVAGELRATEQFTASRFSYTDVLVVARHDERNFTLQPARMAPWEATTCQIVDWEKGQKMSHLSYQQLTGCKDVGALGAFEFYNDDRGRRKLYLPELANAGE